MSSSHDYAMQYAIRLPDGSLWTNPHNGGSVSWSEREGAEAALEQIRAQAAAIQAQFHGEVVYRYCTPFLSDGDDASGLIDELTAWLEKQTGGAS